MQDCYANDATFIDPVFVDLDSAETKAMWAMLITSGKDMRVEFRNIRETANGASAEWDAWYTFSKTGNKVLNRVNSSFDIRDGKIVAQRDRFNFYSWARQALGFTGLLLGWTPFLKRKIRSTARLNLKLYMASKS